MNILHFIYIVFLFFVLTPAILVRLPPKANKWIVALVHGIVFAVIFSLTNHFVLSFSRKLEGYTDMSDNITSEQIADVSNNVLNVDNQFQTPLPTATIQ